MANLVYTPSASVVPFLTADKFANFIVGPVGSTKTTAALIKIGYEAQRIAPSPDGIRRSRVAVIRNTRQMLWDTTIPDFIKWYPDGEAGILEKTNSKFQLKFDDVECEVLFRGLDDANDVRRLLSLQLTFGVMDEFREINPDIYNALTGRLGRYPDRTMNGDGASDAHGKQILKVWGATNPPDMDTFWEKILTEPPKNTHVTIQPSGLSQEADWVQFLPDGYYENLCEGKSEDWVDVYVHGDFGKSLSGQPVFRAFDRDTHVSKQALNYIKLSTHPLIIGMDFGLTPACTINQIDMQGRLLTFADLVSDGMGTLRFCREKLKPLLANRFPGMNVLIIGDPAGQQRAQTDERSVFDILRAEGFRVISAKSNSVVARINAVDKMLTRVVDGKPAHLIDPCCTNLITSLRGGYRYKIRQNGEKDDKPEKNSHSHIADAHQYACLHADGNVTGDTWQRKAVEVKKIDYVWS